MTQALSVQTAAERNRRMETAFGNLLVAFNQEPDVVRLKVYDEALKDLPMDAIEQGAVHLQRTSRGFPSTSAWHEAACEAISARAREAQIQAPHFREEPWRFECRVCEDTGWERHDCTAANRCGRPFCDRQGVEHKHSYVTVCPCRATNHTFQRLHQAYSGDARNII